MYPKSNVVPSWKSTVRLLLSSDETISMYRFLTSLFLFAVLAGCLASQGNTQTQENVKESAFKLLVVSSASNAVEVYNYPEKTLVTTIHTGRNPRDVLLSQDKTTAFINSLDDGTVTVLDLLKFTVIKVIKVGKEPWDMELSPDGRYLYVSNYGESTVAVVDLKLMMVAAKIKVGIAPRSLSFADEGRLIFVADSGSNDVTVIDASTLKAISTIPVGPRPEHVVTNGDYVFVNNQGDNTVTVIHIALLDKPVDTFTAEEIADCGPMVSEQDYTYTTLPEENLVLKLWTEDMSLEGKIPVGEKPYQFVFSPDYKIGFVTNSGSRDISVIDLKSSRVVENIRVGEKPMGLAVF
jgi:YVTN family beta-propeller protein